MFSSQARWLLLAGLCTGSVLGCSGDDAAPPPSGGGSGSGGSSAGSQVGGSSSAGMATSGSSSGGAAGSSATAGAGGSSSNAGAAGSATGGGGMGGASGGGGGDAGSGGSGGGGAVPTAVANIMGLAGKTVTGTATFTQEGDMTKLVLELTACPDGMHASHLHENKDCGNDGNAAGLHWVPNGEMLGDYTCTDGKATHTISKPTTLWTVGDGSDTDVTQFSFMVHEGPDASPGGRIGCGLIEKQ